MKAFTFQSTAIASILKPVRFALLTSVLVLGASAQAHAGDAKSGGLATGSAMKKSLNQPEADIVHLIAEYQSYRKDLVTIANGDASDAAVRSAHKRIAKHDYKELAQGWVAYNAAVAARNPAYNKETRKAAKRNEKAFLSGLDASHDNALKLKSSREASQAIIRNVSAETAQLAEMGSSFRTAAIDMQRKKTPKMVINKVTLARFIDPEQKETVILAGAGGSAGKDPRANEAARPMLGQMLTLAAHMSVTEAKDNKSYSPSTAALVQNKKGARCLKWAKLNLAQCLAAARNTSEEAFCTGRHGLSEVSECWSYMSGPVGTAS